MSSKILIACEESQTVCKAFRAKGFEAYSCDIQEPSGGHPEWHIMEDALIPLQGGIVTTMDGKQTALTRSTRRSSSRCVVGETSNIPGADSTQHTMMS